MHQYDTHWLPSYSRELEVSNRNADEKQRAGPVYVARQVIQVERRR